MWNRLEGLRLLPLLSVAVILLFSLVGFSLWSQRQNETWVVPKPVEPALISQPMVVPTVKNLSAPNPLPTPLNLKVRPEDGKVLVLIPEGDFLMGSAGADLAAAEDEKPQHLVYLDTFWIDKTEITNAQYRRCVVAGVCSSPQNQVSDFRGPQFPVVGVDWNQAHTYCEWVGGRLPTEAEWEKAARGPDGRLYPWGNTFDDTRLNYCDTNCIADWRDFKGDDGYRFTAPVGNYLSGASPYGVLDMSGNVWEWTADWYATDTYQHTTYRNPAGPEQGEQRVIRGGSWYYQDKSSRIAKRHKDTPTARYDNIGFRCALPGSEKSNDLSYRFVPTHIPVH
jgi:formylglycine-generating enzyme required for sulfatase activity